MNSFPDVGNAPDMADNRILYRKCNIKQGAGQGNFLKDNLSNRVDESECRRN